MDIGRINIVQNLPDLADAARYGLLASHPLYSEQGKAKTESDENRTDRVQRVSALVMTNYTRDATKKEGINSRFIDRII